MSGGAHSRRARAALQRMPEVDPAIAALSLWCGHRDADGPTRTAGDVILYGADFETLPLAEQTGVLAHHVLHVALRHSVRLREMEVRVGDEFDARLYNLAADAIVNEALAAGGHAIPRPAVLAGELVRELKGREGGAVLVDWDTDRLYLALTGRSGAGDEAGRQAAEAYAAARDFETDMDAAEAAGEERDGSAEVWAQRLTQAADAGRAAGLGIGTAMAGFADLPDARVPWERRLRGLLNRAVSEIPRRSWKRPANRWVAREAAAVAAGGGGPVFEPGYARDRMRPRVAVAIDTSSSITETQLRLFGAEALAIARKSGAEVHLLAFDEAVHLNVLLETAAQLEALTFRRDGGTSFIDMMETAATLAPSILVILTDLDAAFGDPPDFPVIWAATGAAPPPPFGTLLRVDL